MDRNYKALQKKQYLLVALRKESVDRNGLAPHCLKGYQSVALRKESVDRNSGLMSVVRFAAVALRKESVDRNIHAASNNIKSH